MKNACKLDWTYVQRTKKVDFLDLSIFIDSSNHIHTKTYQKPMNLYLYIPPHSAHPPGLTKSLIYSLLLTYYKQNSIYTDFLHMANLLFQRFANKGHTHDALSTYFIAAIEKIEQTENDPFLQTPPPAQTSDPDNRIFFHLPFHPHDISRKEIRDVYESTCESDTSSNGNFKCFFNKKNQDFMKINTLTVAYSRPQNIRDHLCPSTLRETENIKVSMFIYKFTRATFSLT